MTARCYRHPDIDTGLRCGNCDRPICVRCVVQHPVGIRCPRCARARRVPTLDVSFVYYARAVVAIVVVGTGGVLALMVLSALLAPLGLAGYYLRWLALVGLGYAMGSAVSLAVNRKRGRGLQWIAGLGVVATFLGVVNQLPQTFALNGFFGVLALAAAVYLAVLQLRI
ncbi:MAG: hypothetical protein HY531_00855 [Chloroflexi bacterium]|nr:hypothetical protein [Chloroflexota bacterium]